MAKATETELRQRLAQIDSEYGKAMDECDRLTREVEQLTARSEREFNVIQMQQDLLSEWHKAVELTNAVNRQLGQDRQRATSERAHMKLECDNAKARIRSQREQIERLTDSSTAANEILKRLCNELDVGWNPVDDKHPVPWGDSEAIFSALAVLREKVRITERERDDARAAGVAFQQAYKQQFDHRTKALEQLHADMTQMFNHSPDGSDKHEIASLVLSVLASVMV